MSLIDDVATLAVKLRIENPELRYGQAAFNALHEIRPSLADSIRETITADPFYDDSRLAAFWYSLCEPISVPHDDPNA